MDKSMTPIQLMNTKVLQSRGATYMGLLKTVRNALQLSSG